MNRIKLLILLVIICISTVNAQLLWKISGHGLKQNSYLLGTHHLISISFLDSIPGVYPAFNKSKMVVSEIVFSNQDVSAKIQKASTLPDSVTMKNLLSAEDFDFVNKELIDVLKMNLLSINKMHPSLIQTFYELELYKERAHFDPNTKSDSYFQLVASQKRIPVAGLETVDKQIELLFPKENLKKSAQELVKTIRKKDLLFADYQQLNKLYRSGDIEGLSEMNKAWNREWGVTAEENARQLDLRNIEWVKQLPELMKSNSCFIAVGALHLPGENGLIHLLRKKGYKVKPVK